MKKALLLCLVSFAASLAAYPQTKRDNIGSSNAYSNFSQVEKNALLWDACGKTEPTKRDDAVFSLLVRAGADVNSVPEGEPWNLLYETICRNKGYFLARLIEAGCDVNYRWTTEDGGTRKNERSQVAFAMYNDLDFESIAALVEAGADITTCAVEDYGVVYYAIREEYPIDRIRYFLEKGAPAFFGTVDNGRADESGMFYEPINAACAEGNAELVHMLERYGADVRIRGKPYGSALNAAASGGNMELVQYCLDKGIPFKGKDSEGYCALAYAVNGCNFEVADYLRSLGADIDAAFYHGDTILIAALESAMWGISDNERSADLTIPYYALKLGADPLRKNDWGKSALSVAMRNAVDYYASAYNQRQYAKIARHMLGALASRGYRLSAREACLTNDVKALRAALSDGDGTGDPSPFAYAFASGKADCVDILYAAGLRPGDEDVVAGVALGNFGAVDRCVKNGFDVDAIAGADYRVAEYLDSMDDDRKVDAK